MVTTLAGTGFFGIMDGQGTLSSFANPHGAAIDAAGSFALVVSLAEASSDSVLRNASLLLPCFRRATTTPT